LKKEVNPMAHETKDEALTAAVRLLIAIKKRAMAARHTPTLRAETTPESRTLSEIEGDVGQFLNDLTYDHPEWGENWRVTPEYATDRALGV
jgi:hypothetical protein